MSDLDHAKSLLEMARADLDSLKGMLASPSVENFFTDEVFGFHAQQAAEKCLKAWIAVRGRSYPHTHDLMALIEVLETTGEDPTSLDYLVDLNPFAVQYRYESLDSDDDELDRSSLLSQIQSLFDRVHKLVANVGSEAQ